MSPFTVKYLPVNQRWVVMFGGKLLCIDGTTLFETKAEAVKALSTIQQEVSK